MEGPPPPNWEAIASSWPGLPYLQELYWAAKNAVYTDIESKSLTQKRWPNIKKKLSGLKPILDDWYAPRAIWYAHDIVSAIEQMINAKVFVMRKLSETDHGLLFCQSASFQQLQRAKEIEIDRILK